MGAPSSVPRWQTDPMSQNPPSTADLEAVIDAAWEDRDNPAYLSFYAEDFSDFSRNRRQWAEYKTRVNNGKRWIQLEASNVSFYADLENPDLVTVRYFQDYSSSNYSWRGWKEQLWRETPVGWEIVYEGNG